MVGVESGKTVANTNASSSNQAKPRLGGGNYKTQVPTLEERRKNPIPKDKVKKILKDAMKNGLKLADSKRPDEMKHSDDPNFCPYHRLLGHTIEDCWVFKGRKEISSWRNNLV